MSGQVFRLKISPVWIGLVLMLSAQIVFGMATRTLRPAIEEMPFPPKAATVNALSLGDGEFLYRAIGRWLQDVGDGGGRLRPLKDYDYDRVVAWLDLLDGLDARSDYGHILAAQYFGGIVDPTGGPERVARIIDYFRAFAMQDPARHWQWLLWSTHALKRSARKTELAGALARDLLSLKGQAGVPDWVPTVAGPLYRLAGNVPAAEAVENDPAFRAIRQQAIADLQEKLKAFNLKPYSP